MVSIVVVVVYVEGSLDIRDMELGIRNLQSSLN